MSRPRLSMSPRLQIICKACKDLESQCTLRKSAKYRLPATFPVLLHRNYSELDVCAQKGCSVCRMIRKALLRECYSREHRAALEGAKNGIYTSFPDFNKDGSDVFFYIETEIENKLRLSTRLTLTASRHAPSTEISKEAMDDDVWAKAKQWLDGCANDHLDCAKAMNVGIPPDNPTRLLSIPRDNPTRLLSIGRDDASPVRLVDSDTLRGGRLVPYCALSYCWGKTVSLKTTMANLDSHMRGIPRDQITGTLRDLITVSRKLGIPYVWIDALCIVQGDGGDWKTESLSMYRVYSHAILTVLVCTNSGAKENFLVPRPAESLGIGKFVFAKSYLSLDDKSLEDVRQSSPLMKRAWTFQEELLSSRVLYWSDHGIFWNCVMEQYSEHGAWKALPPRSRRPSWNQMIEEYASRNLFHPTDRLTALAGVASQHLRTTSSPGDVYLAGLWKSSLPDSLLWVVGETPTRPASWDTEPYVAPSWSWASLPGGLRINAPIPELEGVGASNCRVMDWGVDFENANDDPLGPIKCAFITLTGKIRPLLYPNSELIAWPTSTARQEEQFNNLFSLRFTHAISKEKCQMVTSPGAAKWVVVKLDSSTEFNPRELECMQIANGLLVLQAGRIKYHKGVATRVYRRVGAGSISECTNFFDGAETRTVTLI